MLTEHFWITNKSIKNLKFKCFFLIFRKQKREWNKSNALFTTKYSPKSSFSLYLANYRTNHCFLGISLVCGRHIVKKSFFSTREALSFTDNLWMLLINDLLLLQNINVFISGKNFKSKSHMKIEYHFSFHSGSECFIMSV